MYFLFSYSSNHSIAKTTDLMTIQDFCTVLNRVNKGYVSCATKDSRS